jgi:phage-related protein
MAKSDEARYMARIESSGFARNAGASSSRHWSGALCRGAGRADPAAKPLKGFGGVRVMEIVERYRTDAYRAVYTAHFDNAVYVLHVFQKKSKSGIATPKREIQLIRRRVADAERHFRGG